MSTVSLGPTQNTTYLGRQACICVYFSGVELSSAIGSMQVKEAGLLTYSYPHNLEVKFHPRLQGRLGTSIHGGYLITTVPSHNPTDSTWWEFAMRHCRHPHPTLQARSVWSKCLITASQVGNCILTGRAILSTVRNERQPQGCIWNRSQQLKTGRGGWIGLGCHSFFFSDP